MDMEIKVTINAPELVSAIHALATAIQCAAPQPKTEVGITFTNNQESDTLSTETKIETPPVETKKTETMSLTELRAEISAKIKEKAITNDDVRKSLENYGASKLTELDSENYALFRKELLG
jgi:hypothetical protein